MLVKEMFYNVSIFITFFLILILNANASEKDKIIENLKNTKNFDFKFEQNINGKIENGQCTIEYPKKIFCEYARSNNKILVYDGRYLVVKTRSSFYQYPVKKTPLNLILDKNYLLNKIENLDGKIIENKFINYSFIENDSEISIFFNKKNYDLVGWQTLDIYQNLSITYLSSVSKNENINEDLFILPKQN